MGAHAQRKLDPEVAGWLAASDEARLVRVADREPHRLQGATVEERWQILDLLQDGPTGAAEERGILNLLRDASPSERAEILQRVDQNTDHHDVDELIYHDVDDEELRAALLELIGETESVPRELGVVSDFDDTVAPHHDQRFGSEFPGARELYAALEGETPGDVHYLTARPELFAGGVKDEIAARGLPPGSLEMGSLGRILVEGEDGIEAEKIEDVERILELHPGQRFVLIGDDSQRDPDVYDAIRRRHPDRIEAVIIRRTGTSERPEKDGLLYVDDYHEAMAQLRLGQPVTAR